MRWWKCPWIDWMPWHTCMIGWDWWALYVKLIPSSKVDIDFYFMLHTILLCKYVLAKWLSLSNTKSLWLFICSLFSWSWCFNHLNIASTSPSLLKLETFGLVLLVHCHSIWFLVFARNWGFFPLLVSSSVLSSLLYSEYELHCGQVACQALQQPWGLQVPDLADWVLVLPLVALCFVLGLSG